MRLELHVNGRPFKIWMLEYEPKEFSELSHLELTKFVKDKVDEAKDDLRILQTISTCDHYEFFFYAKSKLSGNDVSTQNL